ncbi:MAG: SpoIIE family protein phosphatase [Methanomicrobiales archaeon]
METNILQSLITLFQMICVIIVFAYLFTRSRYFLEVLEHHPRLSTQVLLIIVFGSLSVYGTISGVSLNGAVLNVRDLGPIIAGLTCGPVVGIGAGLIGGTYRMAQGGPYMYTGFVAPVLAGLLSGIVYLVNKKELISSKYAVIFTILVESLISLITILVATPASQVVMIITVVAIPMIAINAVGVFIFTTIIHNLLDERKTRREKDKLEHEMARKNAELEIAADIQRSFLPETIPQLKGYDIAATSLPAKEVGGDFFDVVPLEVIPLSESRMGILVADVSGKGVPAALFMALSRVIVRVSSTWFKIPSEIIAHANVIISADSKTGMFVTLFYGVIDEKERKLTYVNAGHNPPIIFRGGSGKTEELESTGIAIGIMDDAEYSQAEVGLAPGDIILLYTDGVTEAINEKEEMFEVERLMDTIKGASLGPASEIMENIIRAVFAFSGKMPQYDDITLMVVKVL